MARFAGFRVSLIAAAVLAAACAKEPGEQQQGVNDAAVPSPPLTTEMVGGSDPATQPPVTPTTPAADSAPAAAPQAAPAAPATTPAAPAAADTSHADSAHTDH